jgi:hypothetical protein
VTGQVEEASDPVCDFCRSGDVEWRYPCRTFRRREVRRTDRNGDPEYKTVDHGYVGDWIACGGCHNAYERGGIALLAERVATVYGDQDPALADPDMRDLLIRNVLALFAQFEQNRAGDPVTYQRRVGGEVGEHRSD